MISVRDLQKIYLMGNVEVHALNGVSLDIDKGEFVGLMGPSGSGKSTLLHMLGLLDHPTSGDVIIDGVRTRSLSNDQRTTFRLRRLGYVFQDYALMPELTVLENVCLPVMMRGDDEAASLTKVKEVLALMGLEKRLNHLPHELSGGQQQRVAIARATLNKPDILLADEPCANLDSVNSRLVLEQFKLINREMGQTIVMVSHEDWHRSYFDRIVTLKDGVIDHID